MLPAASTLKAQPDLALSSLVSGRYRHLDYAAVIDPGIIDCEDFDLRKSAMVAALSDLAPPWTIAQVSPQGLAGASRLRRLGTVSAILAFLPHLFRVEITDQDGPEPDGADDAEDPDPRDRVPDVDR